MKIAVSVLGSPSLIVLMVSVDVKQHLKKNVCFSAQELCESQGVCPGLPVPNNPYGLCGRKSTLILRTHQHGCTVYAERAKTAAVSCGTSRVSAISTPLWWIFKTCYKKLVTHVESHASAVSLLESGEERYTKATNNNITIVCA